MIRPAILQGELYDIRPTLHGPMMYPKRDIYVGRSLAQSGEYSEIEWQAMAKMIDMHPSPMKVFIDAGANIGVFTVAAAKHIGNRGMVAAFEPQTAMFNALAANVALNSLGNVRLFNEAVGGSKDSIVVPRLDLGIEQNYAALTMMNDAKNGDMILVDTIDSKEFASISVLKIDVEGMEEQVLMGAWESIKKFQPFVYMECNQKGKQASLINFMEKEFGYKCWWDMPPIFRPSNFFKNPVCPWAGNPITQNLICVPSAQQSFVPEGCPLASVVDGEPHATLNGVRYFMHATAEIPADGIHIG
jgi:FkbM family methyltransferase